MASNNREAYFVAIATGVYFAFQVDADIYTPAVAAVLGLTQTDPPANSKVIPIDRKSALRSKCVSLIKATVFKGTGDAYETRRISLVCDNEKTGTAMVGLKGKTVTLGTTAAATSSPWTFK